MSQFYPYQPIQFMDGLLDPTIGTGVAGVTSLTFVDSAVSTGSTITVPATAAVGDIAFLFDTGRQASPGPASVVPAGWTPIAETVPSNTLRIITSRRVLTSGEPGSTVTGINASTFVSKVILVFRPNATILTVTHSTWNTVPETNGDPASQSVLASGGVAPLIVFGLVTTTGTPAFNASTTPAFTATVSSGNIIVGYRISNSAPADQTLDMDDLGNANNMQSGWVEVA